MNHSPEPWSVDPTDQEDIHDGNGKWVVCADRYQPVDMSIENAERIVACVNACKGIPTEDLQDGVIPMHLGKIDPDLAEKLQAIKEMFSPSLVYRTPKMDDECSNHNG